jgi:glycosyltransferase involved in cell wall biosynthesis
MVSVIVVVKNGERYLEAALQSILAQTCRPREIVVVDSHSTDRTPQIAQSFADVRIIQQPGRGLADARNAGLRETRGEGIAFLDYDDLWAPEKLALQTEALAQDTALQYVLCWTRLISDMSAGPLPGFPETAFTEGQPGYTPGAMAARRTAFDRIGGFDSAYSIGCDSDWLARAADSGLAMRILPQVLHFKRIHAANLSADIRTYQSEMLAIFRRSAQRKKRGKETE